MRKIIDQYMDYLLWWMGDLGSVFFLIYRFPWKGGSYIAILIQTIPSGTAAAIVYTSARSIEGGDRFDLHVIVFYLN
jgi:hypothetical protein